jgi:integrating conjugative element protein (TIGR03757 family)
LDEPTQIEAGLSHGLASDPTRAAQQVQHKLRAEGGQVSRRLSLAYQSVVEAWRVGILKVPAVVVDGRFVVYGDTDIAHALSLIGQYQEARP